MFKKLGAAWRKAFFDTLKGGCTFAVHPLCQQSYYLFCETCFMNSSPVGEAFWLNHFAGLKLSFSRTLRLKTR